MNKRNRTWAVLAALLLVGVTVVALAACDSTPATTGKVYTHLTDSTHSSALLRVADAVR